MKLMRMLAATLVVLSCSAGTAMAAQEMPAMPTPGAEHAWLQQFVGDWKTSTEALMEPGKPMVQATGTESVRPLGGFWTITEVKSTMMDMPFTANMTLGYDVEKKKYVGTWVDSMTGYLWEYEGSVDASGKTLTLESEGFCPMNPGKMSKFRETIEITDANHKVFTSAILGENGEWMTMMTSRSERIK